jgi:FixJ family two-component response regulator
MDSGIPARTDLKVFVVDDDASVRASLDTMLRSLGYRVEIFANGQDFLDYAALGIRGCIILDIRLPGASGLEIQRRLAAHGVTTPIIFVTGHGDIEMAVDAMKAGAIEFLTKPYREHDLLEAIRAAMDQQAQMAGEQEEHQAFQACLGTLSLREREVLDLFANGAQPKEVAHLLNIAEATVRIHRRNILNKFSMHHITALCIRYSQFLAASTK